APHVRARPRFGPGGGVCTVADGGLDDAGVRRVVFYLVDAGAAAIERVQYRLNRVGEFGVVLELRGADVAADLVQLRQCPTGIVSLDRLNERPVRGELVEVHPRRRLVGDGVGGHGRSPSLSVAPMARRQRTRMLSTPWSVVAAESSSGDSAPM